MPNEPFHVYLGAMFGEGTPVDLDGDTLLARLVSDADWPLDPTITDMTGVTAYAGTTDQPIVNGAITGTAPKIFDADDVVFTAVAIDGVKTVDSIILYKDDGADGVPIAIYDLATPVTPNGTDITVRWHADGLLRVQ